MREKISSSQKALNLWAIILIVWSIYRIAFKLPEWFDEFIAKPLVFVFPVYYFIAKIDKKKFLTEIWIKPNKFRKDLFLSIGIIIFFIATALLSNFIKYKKLILVRQTIGLSEVPLIILIVLATAVSEEILSRGFVLKKLYDESKNIFTSSFFASILFFFLHVPILFTSKITGSLLLTYIITDLLISLINSFVFIERKSLVLPILIHALYNLSMIFFI